MNISFCLITLNEEQNLPRCLRSVRDLADEIVVVDSGSTDATVPTAQRFGARVVARDWLGYVNQKNFALSLATNDWVFSIDADEELSPELQAEVAALKKNGLPENVAGFSMPRCVLYDGRWIRHGDWYPDRLVRLFRRDRATFAGGKVHERLELDGPVRELRGELFHYSFRDATDHWARCEKYARLWAETQHEAGRRAGPLAPPLHALFRWFRGYVLRRGYLDGEQGRRIARMNAREVALKYRLLRGMNRNE
ncbi:MAG: glycosyltransferase family 2 protein [Verrucomicrobia bacterium]|nr:glycosyltransferase family 2 protein [Verrucomicrobiota bacterium]